MKRIRGDNFNDRQSSAASARQAILERFRARPAPDDPAVIAQREARKALIEAREARAAERKAAKLEAERRAAEEKAAREEAERIAAIERAEQEAAEKARLMAEQKAARDARYAARKARKK
ncbi:MAG: DUF6481 family protein [Hyphomicrobiales bacterium]|nr:DUF6481 family protein [Hyphomicrobiales bacterium]